MLFSDFILHTFKKFKFKFHHSTERHTLSFWPCYIRYALLITDKLPVGFSLLMPLLHLPVKTANRFIHLRHFFIILLSLWKFAPPLPPFCRWWWWEWVESPTKFLKRGGQLDRISTFKGGLLEKMGGGEGCNFHMKNKLKSENI